MTAAAVVTVAVAIVVILVVISVVVAVVKAKVSTVPLAAVHCFLLLFSRRLAKSKLSGCVVETLFQHLLLFLFRLLLLFGDLLQLSPKMGIT